MIKPKFGTTVVILLMLTVIVFAGGKQEKGGSGAVTLTLWDWHTQEIPDVVNTLYRKFEAENNVRLVISNLSFSELPKKLLIAAESKAYPDLSELWAANVVPILAEKGALEPLDQYIEKEGRDVFLGKFRSEFLTTYNGKIYSLPIYAGDLALFYNQTLYEQAGIRSTPKTWDELVRISELLNDPANGIYALALNGNDSEILLQIAPFIAQNNGRVGRIDGKIMINSPESIEAINFVVGLINKYKFVPSYTTYGFQQSRESFMSGKVAMIIDGPWTIPLVKSKNPEFKWATSILPKGKVHGTSVSIGDTEYGMFTTSKHKELCWEFLKFMTSEESNYFWIKNAQDLPALKSVAENPEIKNDPFLKPFLEQMNLGNALDIYRELPPQLESALEEFKVQMQSAALGEKSVKAAMDIVARDWMGLYEQWEKDYGTYTR